MASSSASCSGVVSRMSGGSRRWRWRFDRRRVAGAGLDADRQPHFRNRRFEVARDVDRERLQRRDVEGVQAAGAAHVAADGDKSAFLGRAACCSPPLWGGDGGGGREGDVKSSTLFLTPTPFPSPQGRGDDKRVGTR